MTTTQTPCRSKSHAVMINTGRLDHRGMPIIERRNLSTFLEVERPQKYPMKTILEHLSSTGQGTTLPKDASKATAKTTKETERHLREKQKATAIPLPPRTRIPLSLRARIQTQDFIADATKTSHRRQERPKMTMMTRFGYISQARDAVSKTSGEQVVRTTRARGTQPTNMCATTRT